MTPVPTPRSSGSVARYAAGALERRAPGDVAYGPSVEHVGFEHFPEAVRRVIGRELVGKEIAASAEAPVTKRRSDGCYYQVISGWWASAARLVVIEARRPLERRGGTRFAPAGSWSIEATIHRLSPGVMPESANWHLKVGSTGHGGDEVSSVGDILDVLPPPLVASIRGGSADAWLRWGHRWASETIMAMRIDAGRVHVLRAERKAANKSALRGIDWQSTSLNAEIVETRTLGEGVPGLSRLHGH